VEQRLAFGEQAGVEGEPATRRYMIAPPHEEKEEEEEDATGWTSFVDAQWVLLSIAQG